MPVLLLNPSSGAAPQASEDFPNGGNLPGIGAFSGQDFIPQISHIRRYSGPFAEVDVVPLTSISCPPQYAEIRLWQLPKLRTRVRFPSPARGSHTGLTRSHLQK